MRVNVLVSLNLPLAKPPRRDEFDEKMAQLWLDKLPDISTTWRGVAEVEDAALFAEELAEKIRDAATELGLRVTGILQVGDVQRKFPNAPKLFIKLGKRLKESAQPGPLGRLFPSPRSLKK